jgi:hypothetical protein
MEVSEPSHCTSGCLSNMRRKKGPRRFHTPSRLETHSPTLVPDQSSSICNGS